MYFAVRLVFLLSRSDHVTPILHQLHWLKALQMIQFKLGVLTFVDISTERHRRIWQTNSTSPQISGSEPAYDQHRPHHCQSAVHGCRLSVTEAFSFAAPGTTSTPPHIRIISACFLKPTSFLGLFRNLLFSSCEVTLCHCWHSNRSFYLLTYLLYQQIISTT